jgi:hypothetical protein
MKKKPLAIIVACLIFQLGMNAYAAAVNNEVDRILSSAESLFKAMRAKEYPHIWELLSDGSKEKIVEDTVTAIRKSGGEKFSEEQIRSDFASGGGTAQSYWNGYLQYFDPDKVLEESRWQMGPVKESRAEILITYRKASNPLILQMFNENGSWKVGLIETFGSKK